MDSYAEMNRTIAGNEYREHAKDYRKISVHRTLIKMI